MDKAVTPEKSAPENLSARIYSDLRMKLIVGELRPAESLSIRTLAEEYDVSAMPVREALRQLASEDALIGAAKKAYRVPDLTPDEAANLFFVRSVLEGAAAEIATENVRESDFKVLEKLANDMEKAWETRDPSLFLLANFRFHSRIYGVTGNTALQSMIEAMYVRTGPWLAHGIVELVNPDNWLGEHPEIIQALRDRDAVEARRLMEKDAQWGTELYRKLS
jgi:DNA-binding GntR family transcriptional regulator